MLALAAAAFVAIFVLGVPFPAIILVARRSSAYVGSDAGIAAFQAAAGTVPSAGRHVADAETLLGEELTDLPPEAAARRLPGRDAGPGALAGAGRACSLLAAGPDNVFTDIALFF